MKFKFLTLFMIFSLIFFVGCDSKDSGSKSQELPKFTLTTNDGNTIELEATHEGIIFKGYEGKAVLLDFFATWCPPCKAEIPHLNNLRNRYEGKFEVISILLEENKSRDEIADFIEQYNIQYPISNTPENFELAQAIGGVKSIPTMFLFDPKGEIVEKYVGMVPEEMLASDINRALNIEE